MDTPGPGHRDTGIARRDWQRFGQVNEVFTLDTCARFCILWEIEAGSMIAREIVQENAN
jgi:hypothetical protein